MAKASFRGVVLAESDQVRIVEGNVYFPPGSVHREHLVASPSHTVCPWKGTASYYHVVVGEETNRDAAWYYPSTSAAAKEIEGYVAFWRGVTVER